MIRSFRSCNVVHCCCCCFLLRVLSSCSREVLPFSQSGAEQREPELRLGSELYIVLHIAQNQKEVFNIINVIIDLCGSCVFSLVSGAEQPPCFASQADGFAERYLSAESAADPGGPVSPPDGYAAFPGRRNEAPVFLVKREDDEEPDENAAPELFAMEDGDRPPWSSDPCGDAVDPSFPCAEHQFEPIPFGFPSQSGSHLEDGGPRMHSRSQPDDGHGALSQINAVDGGPIPQPSLQLQYRDPNEENPAASSFCGHNRGGGGGFGLARRMRTPWRSGVGEKRFNCTFCDKGFVRFSQLKEHLRSHTGEKPFSCLQCGRSFTKQCNLIRHAVVHSGEKPYECSLCGKCFTQRSSLKSHQKTKEI
uniref:Si:ch211-155e24.3 n=1 Tax=Cyclopterus lumpus TaxID=8103 RepID=A0A8C2ZNR4_CYCLU